MVRPGTQSHEAVEIGLRRLNDPTKQRLCVLLSAAKLPGPSGGQVLEGNGLRLLFPLSKQLNCKTRIIGVDLPRAVAAEPYAIRKALTFTVRKRRIVTRPARSGRGDVGGHPYGYSAFFLFLRAERRHPATWVRAQTTHPFCEKVYRRLREVVSSIHSGPLLQTWRPVRCTPHRILCLPNIPEQDLCHQRSG